MNLYIAGSSQETDRCARLMASARERGFYITLDWVAAIRANGGIANGMPREASRRHAIDDLRAVQAADITWLALPGPASVGCWAEFGCAFGLGRMTIASGSNPSIFAHAADHSFGTDEEALAFLGELRASKARRSAG